MKSVPEIDARREDLGRGAAADGPSEDAAPASFRTPFAADRPSAASTASVLWPVAGAAVLAGALFLVFSDFLVRQVIWAIRYQADWGHTLVIPFIAGYFVYCNRAKLLGQAAGSTQHSALRSPRPIFRTTWIALVPIVLGVAWYIFVSVGPQAVRHHNLQGAGFALTVFGLVLLFTGYRAMRWLLFPLAYLFLFGQTISDQFMHIVTFRMQDIAAVGSEIMLILLGWDVTRAGNTISLFHGGQEHPLNIAEACSGMRMLMAFLALGVAMAYLGLSRNWQRVLLVILAVPIAIFVNILRVVTLGFLSILDTEFAAGDFHTFVGLVWLIPAFALFLGAMWAVKQIVVEEPAGSAGGLAQELSERPELSGKSSSGISQRLFDRRAAIGFGVACGALAVSGLGFHIAVSQLNIYLRKEAVPLREQFSAIPRTLGEWRALGPDRQLDAATVETLGTDNYLDRTYVRVNELDAGHAGRPTAVHVHIAYYTGMIDAVPHIPDRCMVAGGYRPVDLPGIVPLHVDRSGWVTDAAADGGAPLIHRRSGQPYPTLSYTHRITGRPVTVRMPIGEMAVRTTEFRHAEIGGGESRIYAGFFFLANGQVTANPLEVRRLAFDKTDKHAYYCKVQFTVDGDAQFTREMFAEQVSALLAALLPELMRCLPDWSEIDGSSAASAVRAGEADSMSAAIIGGVRVHDFDC